MTTFTLRGKLFYSDGTESSEITFMLIENLLEGQITTLPAGYTQLDIENEKDPGKTVERYELYLKNSNNQLITEKINFEVVEAEFYELDFWFQNSLGVVEAVGFKSGSTSGIQVSKDQFFKAAPFNVDPQEHQVSTESSEYGETFSATSGFKKKSEIFALIDLLISKRVYQVKNANIYPVNIEPGSFELVGSSEVDGSYQYAINFSGSIAYSQHSFSAIL